MIDIQILLMNISIIALCVAVVYMRRYVESVHEMTAKVSQDLAVLWLSVDMMKPVMRDNAKLLHKLFDLRYVNKYLNNDNAGDS